MYTASGFTNKLKSILDAAQYDDRVADIIKDLTDERTEVDTILRRYSNNYPDDGEEFEYKEIRTDRSDWETKYNDLREKYQRRFFGKDVDTVPAEGNRDTENTSEELEDNNEEIEENIQKGIDSLFEEEERND